MSEPKPKNELVVATCAVMAEVKRLSKGARNAHGNYEYTTVDDMKDSLRPLLAQHGLDVRISEAEWCIDRLEAKSGPQVAARFVFDVVLRHVSGSEDPPERITILLPHTGAQTTGAARSYAVKEWLKSRFLVSTGERDEADSSAPQDYTGTGNGDSDKADQSGIVLTQLVNSLRSTRTEAEYRAWKEKRGYEIAGLNDIQFPQLQQAAREHRASFAKEQPKPESPMVQAWPPEIKEKVEKGKTKEPFSDAIPF